MLKTFLVAGAFCMMFTSCDVRKKDKLATNQTVPVEIKDPTTVEMYLQMRVRHFRNCY